MSAFAPARVALFLAGAVACAAPQYCRAQVTCFWDSGESECTIDFATVDTIALTAYDMAVEALEACIFIEDSCPADQCKNVTLPGAPPGQCVPIGFQFPSADAFAAADDAVSACQSSCGDELEAFFNGATNCTGCGYLEESLSMYEQACGVFTDEASCTGAPAGPSPSISPTPAPPASPVDPQPGQGMATCAWNPSSSTCRALATGPNAARYNNITTDFYTCYVLTDFDDVPNGCAEGAPAYCSTFFGNMCLPTTAPYTDSAAFTADLASFSSCLSAPSSECGDFWVTFFTTWSCPECIPEALAINDLQGTCAQVTSEAMCTQSATASFATSSM